MKKHKKPGDNISLKTKKNESPNIIEWINCQTNLMDSIRYLIENEVTVNGIRNLQNHIPSERVIPYIPASNRSNEADVLVDFNNGEIAATMDEQSHPSIEVESSTLDLPLPNKETEKTFTDDHIDDEDIESWL